LLGTGVNNLKIMKVELGYTLSDFIYVIKDKQHNESVVNFEKAQAIKLKWIYQYNDFLKKSIDIGMFDGLEKIFDGDWVNNDNSSLGIKSTLYSDGKVCFEFFEDGDILFMNDENLENTIDTIGDLFELYPSKMKLINVNVY
jgi:hypothetical protein